MNVLVTGATGFMGSYLVPKLIEKGYYVRLLVRDKTKAKNLFGDTCEIFVGDIESENTIKGCCNNIDVVYHMAALMGHDSPSPEVFERFRKVNVSGVANIINEALESHVKKFIHVSSTAALGLQQAVIYVDENTECKPYTPYQVSKREGEICVLDAAKNRGLPAVIIRPSMVYGPGFKGDFLTLARVCKTGWFPRIGRGKNLSPALYITDLIEALIRFIDKGTFGEIYLLSSKDSYTLEETVMIISKCLNRKIRFVYVPRWIAVEGAAFLELICKLLKRKPSVTKRNIKSVSSDRIVNISKMIEVTGFEPKIPLSVGLPKTIQYFLEQNYI